MLKLLTNFIIILVFSSSILANQHSVRGQVIDALNLNPVTNATVSFTEPANQPITQTILTDENGRFEIFLNGNSNSTIHLSKFGYKPKIVEIDTSSSLIIRLEANIKTLEEVEIVEKRIEIVQKGDTLEFNGNAYKVGPNADAIDMLRKMQPIEIGNSKITAQGENVVQILIDGKSFWGNDPYATIVNIPADMIAKVQLYDEKSESDQFTGFNLEKTKKTINIVTKKENKRRLFGKINLGCGSDFPTTKYAISPSINEFRDEKRVSQ